MGTYDDIHFIQLILKSLWAYDDTYYTADLREFMGTYDDIHFIQLILESLWEHMTTYILYS